MNITHQKKKKKQAGNPTSSPKFLILWPIGVAFVKWQEHRSCEVSFDKCTRCPWHPFSTSIHRFTVPSQKCGLTQKCSWRFFLIYSCDSVKNEGSKPIHSWKLFHFRKATNMFPPKKTWMTSQHSCPTLAILAIKIS